MFDTLKLKIDVPDQLDFTKMERIDRTFDNDVLNEKQVITKFIYPRTNNTAYISHKIGTDFYTIEFSAKILGKKYLDGISEKNLVEIQDKLFEIIPCLNGRPSLIMGEVLRADHTVNFKSKRKTDIIRMLRETANWGRKRIDKRFFESVIFHNTREYLLTYDKEAEIRKFWGSDFKSLGMPRGSFLDLLRFEYRPQKIDVMRKNSNIETKKEKKKEIPKLYKLINDYKNTMFDKLGNFNFSDREPIKDFSEFLFGSGKLDSNLKLLGLFTYLESINYDKEVLESQLMAIDSKSQKSKFRKKLKEFRKPEDKKIDYVSLKEEFLNETYKAIKNT